MPKWCSTFADHRTENPTAAYQLERHEAKVSFNLNRVPVRLRLFAKPWHHRLMQLIVFRKGYSESVKHLYLLQTLRSIYVTSSECRGFFKYKWQRRQRTAWSRLGRQSDYNKK